MKRLLVGVALLVITPVLTIAIGDWPGFSLEVRRLFAGTKSANASTDQQTRSASPANPDSRAKLALVAEPRVLTRGALFAAATARDSQTVRELLSRNADVEERGPKNMTALMAAASIGALDIAGMLIAAGAGVNTYADEGVTAVGLAATAGHDEMVRLLLARGADKNARTINGWTPLMGAVAGGHKGAAETLLSARPDLDSKTAERGHTALMMAAINGDADMTARLAGAGASTAETMNGGATALYLAATQGHTGVIRELLLRGAKVDARTAEGDTPLIAAARSGSDRAVRLLLDSHASVNAANATGDTALVALSRVGPWLEDAAKRQGVPMVFNLESARRLIEAGANVNATTREGMTPLMIAASEGRAELVALLLANGSNRDARRDGLLAQDFALAKGHWNVFELLLPNSEIAGEQRLIHSTPRAASPPKEGSSGDIESIPRAASSSASVASGPASWPDWGKPESDDPRR